MTQEEKENIRKIFKELLNSLEENSKLPGDVEKRLSLLKSSLRESMLKGMEREIKSD